MASSRSKIAKEPKAKPVFDPGSFKDPEGRVCLVGDQVYRTLSPAAAKRMSKFFTVGALETFIASGLLLPCRLVNAAEVKLDPVVYGKTLLHHDRISLVTYPFEWSFEMLRDAALTTLSLLQDCLEKDLILKDATAYNVALQQGRMVFFDTLSIDRYPAGAPWDGYAQFCREFLFPLMLTAYRGVAFQQWFRGSLDGIALGDAASLLGWRDVFRGGVLRHVVLQERLERSFAGKDVNVRSSFDAATFSKDLILSNLRNLRHLIERLKYQSANSEWVRYTEENTYSDDALQTKAGFVESAMKRIAPRRLIDLGCNTGDFSLIAARNAEYVAALDIDPACIDVLYRRLREERITNVVPMVGNLLNPTPGLGWNLAQRRSLFERIGCDAFLALALIHHLRIGGNVPLEFCLDQLRSIAPAGVIEWVGRDDAMVQRMLRNRADVFDDYSWERFEQLLRERFKLGDVVESHGGARRLCVLLPRAT